MSAKSWILDRSKSLESFSQGVIDRAAGGLHKAEDAVSGALYEAVSEAPKLAQEAKDGAVNAFHTVADMTGIMYDKATPYIGKAYEAYANSVAGKYLIDKKNAFFDAVWAKWGTQIEAGSGTIYRSVLGQAVGGALQQSREYFMGLSALPIVGPAFGAAAAAVGSWHATYTAVGELSGDVAPGSGLNELNSNLRGDWSVIGSGVGSMLEEAGSVTGKAGPIKSLVREVEGASGTLIGTFSDPLGKGGDLLRDFGGGQAAKALAKDQAALAHGLILLGKGGKELQTLGKIQDLAARTQSVLDFGESQDGWKNFWGSMGGVATRLQSYAKMAATGPLVSYLVNAPRAVIGLGVQIPGAMLEWMVSGQPNDGALTGPFAPSTFVGPMQSPEEAIRRGATIYVNGMATKYQAHVDGARDLANTSGKIVVGVFNASGSEGLIGKLPFIGQGIGYGADFLQCILDKLSVRGNPATMTLAGVIRDYGDYRQPGGRLSIVAHSQGSIIVSEAIREVAIEKKDVTFLDVTTYGNAAWSYPAGPTYDHRVHDSDLVPDLFGSSSLIGGLVNSRFIRPIASYLLGTPLTDARKDTTVLPNYGAFMDPHALGGYLQDADEFQSHEKDKGTIHYGGNLWNMFRAIIGRPAAPPAFDVEFRERAERYASSTLQPFKLGPDRSAVEGGSAWNGVLPTRGNARDKIQASGPILPGDIDAPTLRSTIMQADGGGERLGSSVSRRLSAQIGFDADVARVHRGPAAAMAAEKMGAQAFTIGRDIFFSQGAFDPASPKGLALLSHELTHVRQQTSATAPIANAGLAVMEEEAQQAEQLIFARSRRDRSAIESYSVDWQLPPGDRQTDERYRQALEARALDIAVDQLDQLGLSGGIDGLDVDVELNLETMGFDEAAQTVAQAIVGSAVRRLSVSGITSSAVIQRDAIDTVKHGVRDFAVSHGTDLLLTGVVLGIGALISAPALVTLGAGAAFYALATAQSGKEYAHSVEDATKQLGQDIDRVTNPEQIPAATPTPGGDTPHAVVIPSYRSPMDAHPQVQLAAGPGGILGVAMSVIAQLFNPSAHAAEAPPADTHTQSAAALPSSSEQTTPTPTPPPAPAPPSTPAPAAPTSAATHKVRHSVKAYQIQLEAARRAEFNAQAEVMRANSAAQETDNSKTFATNRKKDLQTALKKFQGKRLDPASKAAKQDAQKQIHQVDLELAKIHKDQLAAAKAQKKAEADLRKAVRQRAKREHELAVANSQDHINEEFGTDISWAFLEQQEATRNDLYVVFGESREVSKEEYERVSTEATKAKADGKQPESTPRKRKKGDTKYFVQDPSPHSGVTAATGVDLSWQDEKKLVDNGVSKELVDKLSPYMSRQKIGKNARNFLSTHPLTLKDEEVIKLDDAVKRINMHRLIDKYNHEKKSNAPAFADLPSDIQTALMSAHYNLDLTNLDDLWEKVRAADWKAVGVMLRAPDKFKQNKERRKTEADMLEAGPDDEETLPKYSR